MFYPSSINARPLRTVSAHSVNDIVEALKENFRDLKVEHSPARAGDFKGVLVDSDKARRLLGWKPKTKFKVGLKKYIDLVRRRRTGP
jgi:UDP-glucose 4-epimerase